MNSTQEKYILLTGSTGTFGKYLIRLFLEHSDVKLILTVRASSQKEAEERIQEHIDFDKNRIEVFVADLSQDNLGLSTKDYEYITQKTTHILHAAASTRFTQTLKDARSANVRTTENVLLFALQCPHLQRFGHLSSALVAGKRSGVIFENEFEHNEGFINTYEQSKYESELLVRQYSKQLPTVIFRPPLVISKPHASYKGPVNLLSHSLYLIKKGQLPLLPGTKKSIFDIVDSDATAAAIVKLFLKKDLNHLTYHISNGFKAITVGDMIELLEEHLETKLKIKFCGDMKSFRKKLLWEILRKPWLYIIYKKTESYLPEIAYPKTFDNKNLLEELNVIQFGPPPKDVFRSILK